MGRDLKKFGNHWVRYVQTRELFSSVSCRSIFMANSPESKADLFFWQNDSEKVQYAYFAVDLACTLPQK